MTIDLDAFFPNHATWPFIERNSNAKLDIELSSQIDAGQRRLQLNPRPDIAFDAFFDRMTVTSAGLELNRVRLRSQTLDIRPPLVITTGDAVDRVENLFPGLVGTFPPVPPYDGTVTKTVKTIAMPQPPDLEWEWQIISRGRDRQHAYEATYRFRRSAGLVSYIGQVYGVFFVFQRTDIGTQPQPQT